MNKVTCLLTGILAAALLAAGCAAPAPSAPPAASQEAASEKEAAPAEEPAEEEAAEEAAEEAEEAPAEAAELKIGSLKGPTTMGLLDLMEKSDAGEAEGNYSFTMAVQPDEIAAMIVQGKLDIALVPANLASVLYNKTKGAVAAVDINTLGVLYCVTGDESVGSLADLSGKTVLMTGQGATPEYALRYLLSEAGIDDCTLEFCSEAAEAAAMLKEKPETVAVLPQPFATVAAMQNEAVKAVFSLSDAWDEIGKGSRLVTGVTIVRKEVFERDPDAVALFVKEQAASAEAVNADPEAAGELCAARDIIANAKAAAKAIPNCNIVCITGEEMKQALSGYLETLHSQDPAAVGGALPGDDFYLTAE